MFVSLAFFLAAQQITIPFGKPPPHPEKPRAPIQVAGPMWADACKDSDDWDRPAPPVRIHANTYLVGTCGISSILVMGDAGGILIDGGPENAADGILCFGVAPGFTVSEMTEEYLAGRGGAKIVADIPLGRVSSTDEVAEAIRWLATEAPAASTGSVIDVNGASYVR